MGITLTVHFRHLQCFLKLSDNDSATIRPIDEGRAAPWHLMTAPGWLI